MTVVLTEEQEAAAARIREHLNAPSVERQWLTMHGLGGTGKTTVLGTVSREFPWAWVCTLTGRAADVLRKKTGASAMTIHSAFYRLAGESKFADGKDRLEWAGLHQDNALDDIALLLDESSMINGRMADDILRTGCRIIACGDPGQLPPIEGEQFFRQPDVMLKKVHRQALDSPILRQAHWVRLGRGYNSDGEDFQVVKRAKPEDVLAADIIICWRNVTRKAVNAWVRKLKGITQPNPQAGEPVMCLKNCYEHGLWNGATYNLTRDFHDGDSTIYLEVDGREEEVFPITFEGFEDAVPRWEKAQSRFAFAYCTTVHKAQGSEYPFVILIDEYSRDEHRKEWLYTAITRAQKRVLVVRP